MSPENTNIFLIGLMGAGKSTVGRVLARKLNRRFIDSDHALEERCGVKIPTIFEMEGEAGFRMLFVIPSTEKLLIILLKQANPALTNWSILF